MTELNARMQLKMPHVTSNSETIIFKVTSCIDSLICLILGQVFNSVSILWTLVLGFFRLPRMHLGIGEESATTSCSATEYILDTLGEFEGDGDDLIEFLPAHRRLTNMALQRVRQSILVKEVVPMPPAPRSMKRRRSPRSSFITNRDDDDDDDDELSSTTSEKSTSSILLAEKERSLDRSEEHRGGSTSNSATTAATTTITERIKSKRTQLAEKSASFKDRVRTERTRLATKGGTITERIIPTTTTSSSSTDHHHRNRTRTFIADKMNIVKSRSFTDRTKLMQRSSSVKERIRLERMG